MTNSITLHQDDSNDALKSLENEIALLENELKNVESDVNAFESQIRSQLYAQIVRIRELTELYKSQKKGKKARRLEQKKKGKNYQEPKGIQKTNSENITEPPLNPLDQQELKRLYKEAIVHVHPDKFVNEDAEKTERATALTVQLNAIYKSGDLEELNHFHEHIISGNAMSHVAFQPESIADTKAMLAFLKKKKQALSLALKDIKESHTYTVYTTYEDPLTFIDELRFQFEERIRLLEKRTRKG